MILTTVILFIIIGTLAAIVYALRVLVSMERRVARIELHIEGVVNKIMREEFKIEKSMGKKKKR